MIGRAARSAIDRVEPEGSDSAREVGDGLGAGPGAGWKGCRVAGLIALAAALAGYGLAAQAAAYDSVQASAATVYTMSPGRVGAIVAALVGLVGAVNGGAALVRSGGPAGPGRRGAVVALALGSIGLVIGGLVVATADGGVGTGNGLGGGVVAMVVGLIGMTLGGLALARARRAA